jgi:hypothetical protein
MIQFIPLAISLLSSFAQADAEIEAGKTAKKIGEYNATIDENDALQTELDSLESVRRMRADGRKFIGSQRASYAKGGVMVDTGSPLEVMSETEGMLKLQQLDEFRQSNQQASKLRRSAQMSRFYGETELRASQKKAGATLLAGVGQAAQSYFNAKG